MKSENILKGKIAESIVEELLKKSGSRVYSFGSEALLQNLSQAKISFDRESEIGKKIASIPDFVVLNAKDEIIFAEIKFRTHPEALEEELLLEGEYLEKFWEAKIIIVTTTKPHFRVLVPPYFRKSKTGGWPIPIFQWKPIEEDDDLAVNLKTVQEFEKLVEKYCFVEKTQS